jgi:hypothetical protein
MRLLMIVAVLVGAIGAGPARGQNELVGHLRVDGFESGAMDPGQASRWTLGFTRQDGASQTGFEIEHQKYMHLIVVSEDLASFAHIHPTFAPSTGVFRADVNVPSPDPDNQDIARVITRPGAHFLFAEVRPAGGDLEQHRFAVRATGAAHPEPLEPESADTDGWISHLVDGGALRVRLRPEAMKTDMVHLTFSVQQRTAAGYVDVNDLEPWLGMDAHAVMIGGAGATAADRVFRHLHAGHHDDHGKNPGGHILFMLHGDDVPPSGVYRVWLQVKRQGRVATFPFTVAL